MRTNLTWLIRWIHRLCLQIGMPVQPFFISCSKGWRGRTSTWLRSLSGAGRFSSASNSGSLGTSSAGECSNQNRNSTSSCEVSVLLSVVEICFGIIYLRSWIIAIYLRSCHHILFLVDWKSSAQEKCTYRFETSLNIT